jgi:flagellar hook-length control protein FliK
MASTDFLLQLSTVNTRAQTIEQNKSANERVSSSAPAQSFSALYAQQRSTATNQQQQREAVLQDKQQQSARQAAAKNAAAAQAHKEKPVAPSKARTEGKTEKPQNAADDAPAAQSTQVKEPTEVADGKALPPATDEASDELDNPLIDPILLMALATQSGEPELAEQTLEGEDTEGADPVNLLLSAEESDAEVELSGELLAKDEQLKQKNTLQLAETQEPSEQGEATLLNAGALKTGERTEEKITFDKNPMAAVESSKSAVDTLLNKAVAAADGVRADLQSRPESSMAHQAVRQVPGPAVAMQQPGWSQQVTDKVMWMSSQNLQSAEIKLDPAELGRLDVKVSINQEQTQVTFTSAHAGVRDSLESQMYRLREMFAQQGMQNVDVNVADQSQAQQDSRERTAGQGRTSGESDAAEESVQHASTIGEQHDGRLGMVDYYA